MYNSVEKSISVLQAAVRSKPEDLVVQRNLMSEYLKEKNSSEFLNAFENLIKLFPIWPQFHYDLLMSLTQLGYAASIKLAFDEAIKRSPNKYILLYGHGIIQQIGSEKEGAIESYKKVINIEPSFASAYYSIGITYMTYPNEQEKATEYLYEAKSQNHRLAEAYWFLGFIKQSDDQISSSMFFESFIDFAYPYLDNHTMMNHAKEQAQIWKEQFNEFMDFTNFLSKAATDEHGTKHNGKKFTKDRIQESSKKDNKKWWEFWKS